MQRLIDLLKSIFQKFFTFNKKYSADINYVTGHVVMSFPPLKSVSLLGHTHMRSSPPPAVSGMAGGGLWDEIIFKDAMLIFQTKKKEYYRYKNIYFTLPKGKAHSYFPYPDEVDISLPNRFILTRNRRFLAFLKENYPELFII